MKTNQRVRTDRKYPNIPNMKIEDLVELFDYVAQAKGNENKELKEWIKKEICARHNKMAQMLEGNKRLLKEWQSDGGGKW